MSEPTATGPTRTAPTNTAPTHNLPTREDPIATALSEVVGGPAGRRARPHSWWTPIRVLLAVFTVVFALGLIQKYPCGKTDWSNESVRYSRMCYSDVPYLYTGRGFAEQHWPYADSGGRYPAMEYPVLISYLAWGASELTSLVASGPSEAVRAASDVGALWGLPGMIEEVNTYFLVTALLLFGFGLGTVFFLSGASPGRPWDAMAFALSPVLLVTGLVNWDLLAVFFTAGALWGWARGKPVLAGVMVGLGTAAKLYPLFLLGAFLVDVLWRRPGKRRSLDSADLGRFGLAVLGAVGAWIAANLPALVGDPELWKVFWSFNSERGADLGSLWLVANQIGGNADAHLINTVSWIAFGGACLAILALGLRAPQRPRVAQIGFLIVAAFLIVNKVYSPQYVLWLLPLAVLARPRWRDLLIWQVGELTYFAAVWLYLGGWLAPAAGETPTAYHLAILVRVAAELYLVALVVGDVLDGRPGYPTEPDADGSADDDVVHVGRGEPDPDADLLADRRRLDP